MAVDQMMTEETMQEFDDFMERRSHSAEAVIEYARDLAKNKIMQTFYEKMFVVVSKCQNCQNFIFPTHSSTDRIEVSDDSVLVRGVAHCRWCGESKDVNIRKTGENVFNAMLAAMSSAVPAEDEPPF